jgi:hypothetical protein
MYLAAGGGSLGNMVWTIGTVGVTVGETIAVGAAAVSEGAGVTLGSTVGVGSAAARPPALHANAATANARMMGAGRRRSIMVHAPLG